MAVSDWDNGGTVRLRVSRGREAGPLQMDWWGGGQAMAQVFPGVCGSLHPAKAAWGVLEYGKKEHTVLLFLNGT